MPGSGLPACDRNGNEDGGARGSRSLPRGGVSKGLASGGVCDAERRRWWFLGRTPPAAADGPDAMNSAVFDLGRLVAAADEDEGVGTVA